MKMDFSLILLQLLCAVSRTVGDEMHPRIMFPRQYTTRLSHSHETEATFWNTMAQSTLATHLTWQRNEKLARNVIMFLGDGLSIPTLTAARIYNGGEQSSLVWENFPYVGLSKTYCVDTMVADSACSATAYLCGVKANKATIGVTAAVQNFDCNAMRNTSNHVYSFIRKAQLAGMATGIVTNTRITNASPAGAYAHTAYRDWESDTDVAKDGRDPKACDDIAEMLIRGETGRNLNVILGGGRQNFRPFRMKDEEGLRGRRSDGMDLIAEWQGQKNALRARWAWAWNRATMEAINVTNTDFILGLFEPSHMNYNLDNDPRSKPTLAELTRLAIASLSRNPKGFILFVEGGRIDHAHHETRAQYALDETIQFDLAIRAALSMVDVNETLVVMTSDHSHTMSLNGYPFRGRDLLGIAGKGSDLKPYSTLSYGNGPGYKRANQDGSRYDISADNFTNPRYQYPALAPLVSETHGGDDVGVFACGPWAHLYSGTYEQNYIAHVIEFASCLGQGLTFCNTKDHEP